MKDFEKYKDKIWQPTESISAEELILYAQNKLTDTQKRKVELAISEDEFLADASEGISMMKKPANLATILVTINKNLSRKTVENMSSSDKKANLYWAVAAGIIVALFGIFLLFREPTENQLAEQTFPPTKPQQEISASQSTTEQEATSAQEVATTETQTPVPAEPVATPPAEQATEPVSAHAQEGKPKEEKVTAETLGKIANPPQPTAVPAPIAPQVAKTPISAETKASATNQGLAVVANSAQMTTSSRRTIADEVAYPPTVTKNAIAEVPTDGMIRLYTGKQYNIATDLAEVSLKQNPKHPTANYIAGASYLILGKNTLAKNKLLLLSGQENTETFAGADLKAIIDLVRADKFEDAKALVLQHKWENDRLFKVE